MKRKRELLVTSLAVAWLFLLSAIGICGTPLQINKTKQPATQITVPAPTPTPAPAMAPAQAPTMKKVPRQMVKIYAMAIEGLNLDEQCQLKFTVRNTGANLTAEEHNNSYLTLGQGSSISFSVFDPTGKLRTKGQTKTYLQNHPTTAVTNIKVLVTLFNGVKISRKKLLKPKCPPPTVNIPAKRTEELNIIPTQPSGQDNNIIPSIPSSGPNITPVATPAMPIPAKRTEALNIMPTAPPEMPVPATPVLKPPNVPVTPMAVPKTILQVERLGGDLQTWDSWAGTDTSMQKMDFRWKTEIGSLLIARWEVALAPDFTHIIAKGQVTPIPAKGIYGNFSIDLSSFSESYPKPATFYIHVIPVKFEGVKARASQGDTHAAFSKTSSSSANALSVHEEGDDEPSTTVRISLIEAGSGPTTQFRDPDTVILQLVDEEPETLVISDEGPETLVISDEGPETLVISDEGPETLIISEPVQTVKPEMQINNKDFTKAEFDKLPANTIFEVAGKKVTKAQMLGEYNKVKAMARKQSAPPDKAAVERAAAEEWQAKIEQDNLKAKQMIASAPKIVLDPGQMKTFKANPKITATLAMQPLSPGEDVFIKGTSFGSEKDKAKVRLKGNFSGGQLNLIIKEIKPDFIHARLPGVSGVMDHPVNLQVEVEGRLSNEWPTGFEAERVKKSLDPPDLSVAYCTGQQPSSCDKCNHDSRFISTFHTCGSYEIGFDSYKIGPLKNGWTIQEVYLKWSQGYLPWLGDGFGKNAQVATYSGISPYSTSANLKVSWMYIGMGGIVYDLSVWVEGPKGVPHN